ncbi:MAG: CapA family protein [Desulfobacterales bacterium]|nr:CapA family protein [Desulfobacterales bacterium]
MIKKKLTAIFIVSLLLLFGCKIDGKVSYNMQGLEGVNIELKPEVFDALSVLTDKNGVFAFNDLTNGNYVITPSLEGYIFEPSSQNITINNFPFSNLTFIAKKQYDDSIKLIFTGDIMLERNVKKMIDAQWTSSDLSQRYSFPFLKIADYLKSGDLTFGNLESIISDKGEKKVPWPFCCSFRAETDAMYGLLFAGFDVVSTANNHSADYGKDAFIDSLYRLDQAGLTYCGGGTTKEKAHSPAIFNVKNTKIAYLAYTNVGNTWWDKEDIKSNVAWLDAESLKTDIYNAIPQADIIIVSMHFGVEYQTEPNNSQKELAQLAIDSGASLVIGHHPHVTQPVEAYKNGYIAYSLGNFVFDQSNEDTHRGLVIEAEIVNNQIVNLKAVDILINEFYQPEIVSAY